MKPTGKRASKLFSLGIKKNTKINIHHRNFFNISDEKLYTYTSPTTEELTFNLKFGSIIEDYTIENVSDKDLLTLVNEVNSLKDKLSGLSKKQVINGRYNSCIFNLLPLPSSCLNRASIKLVNLNYLCDLKLNDKSVELGSTCHFADLCSAPGGFTYWIKNATNCTNVTSYMFSLGDIDFSPKLFEHYNENFKLKNMYGNIYNDKNCNQYIEMLNDTKMDFVLSDGGFSMDGNENYQEIYSKLLYISQCLLAIKILKDDGFFVCKFFDIYTTFSQNLLYFMSKCFETITIVKPYTSRAANSEKYIVFKKFKYNQQIVNDLTIVKQEMISNSGTRSIISFTDMSDDFIRYLKNTICKISDDQKLALEAFVKPTSFKEAQIKNQSNKNTVRIFFDKWFK